MCMATKTITIMEDAYEKLAREKTNGESFSDVIRRLTSKNKNLDKFFAILADDEVRILKSSIKEGRRRGKIRSKKGDELFTA